MATFQAVKDGMGSKVFPWRDLMVALEVASASYPSLHVLVKGVVDEYTRGVTDLQRVLAIAGKIRHVMQALFKDATYASLQNNVVDCLLYYTDNQIDSLPKIPYLEDGSDLFEKVNACAKVWLAAQQKAAEAGKTSKYFWGFFGGSSHAQSPEASQLTSA